MDLGKKSKPIQRPRALVCYICGREYGTASLPIHLKTCKQKWEQAQALLPPKQRRPLPQAPEAFEQLLTGTVNTKKLDQYNEAAFQKWDTEALVPCPNCARTFLPDRLTIHLRSCKPGKPLKLRCVPKVSEPDPPETVGYQPVRNKRNPSNVMIADSGSSPNPLLGQKVGANKIITGPAYDKVLGGFEDSKEYSEKVLCYYCGKKFSIDWIEVHQTSCKKDTKHLTGKQQPPAWQDANSENAVFEDAPQNLVRPGYKVGGLGQRQNNPPPGRRPPGKVGTNPEKPSKWRQQHDAFIKAIRLSKQMKVMEENGASFDQIRAVANQIPSQADTSDLVTCPHCARKFAPATAERHIPKCEHTINKPKPPPQLRAQLRPQDNGRSPLRAKSKPRQPDLNTDLRETPFEVGPTQYVRSRMPKSPGKSILKKAGQEMTSFQGGAVGQGMELQPRSELPKPINPPQGVFSTYQQEERKVRQYHAVRESVDEDPVGSDASPNVRKSVKFNQHSNIEAHPTFGARSRTPTRQSSSKDFTRQSSQTRLATQAAQQQQQSDIVNRQTQYASVQCPHCERRFSEKAALRHVPICANTKSKPKRLDQKQAEIAQQSISAQNFFPQKPKHLTSSNFASTTGFATPINPPPQAKTPIIQKPMVVAASNFCTGCGWQHREQDRFCGGCGSKRV